MIYTDKVKKMTREAVIDELTENEVDAFFANGPSYSYEDYLRIAIYEGIKGYKDYANEDLIEEWNNNIGEDTGESLEIVEEVESISN